MRRPSTMLILGFLMFTGGPADWAAILLAIFLLAGSSAAQSAPPAAPAGKTAGQTMKNVQVLKDIPDSDWGETMFFIGTSLGVTCEHCHTQPFDSDAKKAKLTARSMMKMVREINAANFDGRPVVTCNSCHQGRLQPQGMPSLWSKTGEDLAAYKKQIQADRAPAPASPAPPAPPAPAASLLTAAQVFAAYRQAVGGDAVKSVHLSATLAGDLQAASSLDLDAVFPDKVQVHLELPGGHFRSTMNGDRGWIVSERGTRDLSGPGLQTLRTLLRVAEPVKFAELEAGAKVTGTEKLGDRTCTIVESDTPAKVWRLYFDAQTGLLYRAYSETRLPGFGVMPTEAIYEDYRSVGGVHMPFSITTRNPSDRVLVKIGELQTNVSEDPARFEPPAPGK